MNTSVLGGICILGIILTNIEERTWYMYQDEDQRLQQILQDVVYCKDLRGRHHGN